MSLVTRDTNTPRRVVVCSAMLSRWMWSNTRTRRLHSACSAAAHQPVVGEAADKEDADRDHGCDQAGEQHELGPEPARAQHAVIEDDLDQDRDGQLSERGDDREHDRRGQTDAQLGARSQPAPEDVECARRDPARRRDVVVLEGGEDALGELVAGLGRRGVGNCIARRTVQ